MSNSLGDANNQEEEMEIDSGSDFCTEEDMLEEYIEKMMPKDKTQANLKQALLEAINNHSEEDFALIKVLLKEGANPYPEAFNACINSESDPNSLWAFETLINYTTQSLPFNLIYDCIKTGVVEYIEILAKAKFSFNSYEGENVSPLMFAYITHHSNMIQALLDGDAGVDYTPPGQPTVLYKVCENSGECHNGEDDGLSDLSIIDMLLSAGANPRLKVNGFESPYEVAIRKGHKGILKSIKA